MNSRSPAISASAGAVRTRKNSSTRRPTSANAIAITDRNTFAGIVRAYVTAKDRGIRLIPACRINLLDGPSLLAYPTDKAAYARLSALLTKGNLRTEKEKCFLYKKDVYEHAAGSYFVIVPPAVLNEDFDFDWKRVRKFTCDQSLT